MNRQRLEAYLELIQALLDCPKGGELALLQANEALVDPDLLQVIEQVATQIAREGEGQKAKFLRYWAEKLSHILAQAPETASRPRGEGRSQAYLTLIEALLNCPDGQESQILAAHPDLIDAGLVQVMAQVAQRLAEDGDTADANYLLEIARQLAETLSPASSEQLTFLKQVLKTTQESNGDPQVVYPLLQANLEHLNERLAQILRSWAEVTFPEVEPELARGLGSLLVTFSNLLQQFPHGDPASNLEIALAGYQIALGAIARDTFPQQWASIQNNLGEVYRQRLQGDKAENLEAAIDCFQSALQVYTRAAFPQQWAIAQDNLGDAYHHRIRGDRAQNLEQGIAAYSTALEFFLSHAAPAPELTPQKAGKLDVELEDFW